MCGIAGLVGASAHGTPEVLATMLGVLHHRGPDDQGTYEAPGVALGIVRLAIIDLVTGRQPMTSEDGRCAIVFNGEIYNFLELRAELERAGHRFKTQSDTEVVLRAWAEHGEACVDRLRGMFAFAIWDGGRRALFLARDRVGKKPLYYWQRDGHLAFASEIKALVRHPALERRLDWRAFHHYLAFGYTPPDRSIFDGIAKLPPAHVALVRDGAVTLRRYWEPPRGAAAAATGESVPELAARIRAELREAVRLRLQSDVPLGVFLSGGLDSSAIVACMRELTSAAITTVSVGFGPSAASWDELPYARLVARRFGTAHHEEVLDPDVDGLARALVRHFDEPFADSSAIPTFVVAQATARRVKVALSGIGGDEVFAGYPRYLGVRLSEAYARVPRAVRGVVGALARLVPESDTSRNLGDWVRRFVAGAERPLPDRYLGWTRFFDEAALAAVATEPLRGRLPAGVDAGQRAAFAAMGHGDPVDGAFRIDLASYLPDDLLTLGDRMSMAHSLELRAPFCDHRLIETSLRIPPALKTAGLRPKALLKAAFADVLPAEVLRHRKQGFMIPLGRWLRGPLRPLMEDLLAPARVRARGLFRPEAIAALQAEHLAGARTHADRLWTVMMAEMWMREYLDQGGAWTLR